MSSDESVQDKIIRHLWDIVKDSETQPSVIVKALSELDRIYARNENAGEEIKDENYFIIKPVKSR